MNDVNPDHCQLSKAHRTGFTFKITILKPGDDGKLHLPNMQSPEYSPSGTDTPDNNYNLALLRWGCATLLQSATRLKIDDPLIPRWKEVLVKLVDPPVESDGILMIGKDLPYGYSHRHYSHLIGIYPLHIYNWDQPENREMIDKSMRYWFFKDGGNKLAGYSYTGFASMLAATGKGSEAIGVLSDFFKLNSGRAAVHANTMYFEGGGVAPVIETPLSAAQTVNELLLQSWGRTVRIFPAVPDSWDEVSFHNMRAQGAFLVSAARRNGRTQFVRIKSLAGEPCRIRTDLAAPIRVLIDGKPVNLASVSGELDLPLLRGQEAILVTEGTRPELTIAPVLSRGPANPWGLKVPKH